MCTVIVHVPAADEPLRLLAVRDEDPEREWDPLGPWWPDSHPGMLGVRDRRANGAWLAADTRAGRLAVLLNRAEKAPVDDAAVRSRGGVVLESAAGRPPEDRPATHGFNLVEIDGPRARVITWDGVASRTTALGPGTHMIAHDDVDDAATPRIARWLAPFADAHDGRDAEASADWFAPWLALLEASAELPPTDDEAIIRDNRPHGYPTMSLLVCLATVHAGGIDLAYGTLDEPGHWNTPKLE